MREREHRRRVGSRHDRMPRGGDIRNEVAAQRAEQLERQPAPSRFGEARRQRVTSHATGADPRVLHVHPAERDDQLGVFEDRLPRCRAAEHLVGATDDVGEDHLGRAERVAVDRPGVTANAVQEAVQLALRVVKPTGARPAV